MGKSADFNIPTSYTIHVGSDGTIQVDADLDNIRVKELPRIELGDINMRLKELPTINMAVKELPRIELTADTRSAINLAITEIPDIRAHLPAHFDFGMSILGIELWNLSICGEAQVITEKYVPRRVELCR
jgi:hypothetical protein